MALADELKQIIRGEVEDAPETLEKYARDASVFYIRPTAVVFPKDTEDIKNLVKFTAQARSEGRNISLTPRSAGTDMSGGAITESIIVDMTRHFNRIKEISGDRAVVEPGVYYRDFEKETLKTNRLLPSYPASRELCTVGGMVANNSGGEKTLRYGKTERYVEAVKMVLDDGEEYLFKKLTAAEFEKKKALETREGKLYRSLSDIIEKNIGAIIAAQPNVTKNSSGYALWNVYDAVEKTFDTPKLITGSQGTLGIITEITFTLVEPKPVSRILVIFLKNKDRLAELASAVLAESPESFESYDDHTFRLAVKFLPELLARVKGKFIKIALGLLPELWMILTGGMPKLVLLAEFTGKTEEETEHHAKTVLKKLRQSFPYKMHVTDTTEETQEFFVVRRESFNLLREHVRGLRTAPFIDDFAVHPKYLPEFLGRLEKILQKYKIIYTIAGHIGDGNFHIIPLMDFRNPNLKHIITNLSHEVYDLVLSYKGTITAEHNDGLIRASFVRQEYGDTVYHLFEETKKTFDPLNIFNPGKKIGGSLDAALAYLDIPKNS